MKKKYTKPTTLVEEIEGFLLLVESNNLTGTLNDDLIIDYGGIDDNGILDPSANGFNLWEDDSWE